MKDCTNCRLFSAQQETNQCLHTNRPGGLLLTKQAYALSEFQANARILDVACGTGATVNLLKEMNDTVIGLDHSLRSLSLAALQAGGAYFIAAEANCIPFEPDSFDGVFMECAMSLSNNSKKILLEINRVLKPDGKAIITDIFLKDPIDDKTARSLLSSTCLAGVRPEVNTIRVMKSAGFEILFWQDHTQVLKQWMAQQILRLGSIKEIFRQLSDQAIQQEDSLSALSRIRLGYYLVVLRKPSS